MEKQKNLDLNIREVENGYIVREPQPLGAFDPHTKAWVATCIADLEKLISWLARKRDEEKCNGK